MDVYSASARLLSSSVGLGFASSACEWGLPPRASAAPGIAEPSRYHVAAHARAKRGGGRRELLPSGDAAGADGSFQEKEEEIFSLSKGWSPEFSHMADELESRYASGLPGGMEGEDEDSDDEDDTAAESSSESETEILKKKKSEAGDRGRRSPDPSESSAPRTTHRKLKIMAGDLKGKRLLSPADRNVRPMMEMVRGAVFNMVQALAGSPAFLPGGRWLDLYSGTGSVGIEALSRGCELAHFVELDPWVMSNVLSPNLMDCNYTARSVIHPLRVETFLDRVEKTGAAHVGGPFEFVSVTPPYELVVYADLMAQIARSPLLTESTCMIVEYPLLSRQEIPETCGPLAKIRDRKYGRTNIAIYGPAWLKED